MENFSSSRKVIWMFAIIAILAIAAAVIVALVYRPGGSGTGTNNTPETPQLKVERTTVPTSQLPNKFPSDLPIEANAKVIDNFNSTASNGNYQATRQYESAKSPDDNYKAFDSFFKKGNWETLSASNTETNKSLTVKKGDTIIQALFYTNTVTKASVAKISVTIVGGTK